MASPFKRIRLTPRKDSENLNQRYTQESKVTSTPQRLTGKTAASPNLSSIQSTSGHARTLFSVAFSEHNFSDIEEVSLPLRSFSPLSDLNSEKSELTVDDYDDCIKNLHRTKYQGKVWTLYQPLHNNTLYAQILLNPQDIPELIMELMVQFDSEPEHVIQKLLKLCVDVCGYQHFDVSNHYIFQRENSREIIDLMEKKHLYDQAEVLITSGRYLMLEHETKLSKLFKSAIYSFLQKFIMACHRKGFLYEDHLPLHFFAFVKAMACSTVRSVRHTGVIFANKIVTSLLLIYNEIMGQISLDLSTSIDVEDRKRQINDYLEYFYIIFIKNCRLLDNKFIRMRLNCVYELSIWVKYFPKMYITHFQAFSYSLKLVTDPSKDVRYAVLNVCESFVKSDEIRPYLKLAVPDYPEHVGRRFYDTDLAVAVKAIDIYKCFLTYDESLITKYRFNNLMNLVSDKHFKVGEAASQFLVTFVEKYEKDQQGVLMRLANFSMKPGDSLKSIVVEGCLSCCPAIRNWKLYVELLLREDLQLDLKEAVAELFAEAVHQVLKGRSTHLRISSRNVVVTNATLHGKVVECLSSFPDLLEKFEDHPKILVELLKIPVLVNEAALNKVPEQLITAICSNLKGLFDRHDDEVLIKSICQVFFDFGKTTHEVYVKGYVENILEKYAEKYEVDIVAKTENVVSTVLKFSILFSYFDLTKYCKWESIFDKWGEVSDAILVNLVRCCRRYLVWNLKNLENDKRCLKKFPKQIRDCNEFTSSCFNMLQNLQGEPLHLKTFKHLCGFFVDYSTVLKERCKSMREMEKLKMRVDEYLEAVLISFMDDYIIHNTTIPVTERRVYVVKFMDLVCAQVINLENLVHVVKYYHKYYKEYCVLIETSMSQVCALDVNTFLMIIVHCMAHCYEDMLDLFGVVDMTTQNAKDLKLLIKQLLLLKEFKVPGNKFVILMYFSINYAFQDSKKWAFLYFTKYFLDKLDDDEAKKAVFKYLWTRVPKEAGKDDAVLFVANYVGGSKPQQALKESKRGANDTVPKQNKKEKKKAKKNKKRDTCKSRKENIEPDTEVSDDMTIHDSESDDLENSLHHLKV